MRKFVLGLIAAGSALAVAAPAAAQYYQPYGYNGYGNGNGYGYNRYNGYDRYGTIRSLQQRIYNIERGLGGVRPDQANRIAAQANNLERRLRIAARNGLNPYEAHDLDVRIGQLEQWKINASGYGYGRNRGYGNDRYNGYNGSYRDRDRDGRDDRWEDDQGRDHDD